MDSSVQNRRSFLFNGTKAGATALAATALLPNSSQAANLQDSKQQALSDPKLDKLFAPIENAVDSIPVAQKRAASQALNNAINSKEFRDQIKFEKAQDGRFYPVLSESDAKTISQALTKFFKDAYGKDVEFGTAVTFKGAQIDPKSTFRKRTFFIANEPIEDSAKSVAISFGQRLKDMVAKVIPESTKKQLDTVQNYVRDFIYTNQFMIAPGQHKAPEDFYSGKLDIDKVQQSPGGWHVFSKNRIRLDYNPLANATEDSPGSEKGIFAIRNSYNVSLAGEGEDKMLTVAMGHNHTVIHQSALIDSSKENGGGDHFKQVMSKDPKGPVEGQRHLPYYNHEVIPSKSAEIYTDLAA